MKRQPSPVSLLTWAVGYIDRMNAELRIAHLAPRSGRIEPPEVEREYENVEHWLRKARRAIAAASAQRKRKHHK